jgi:hypothetical protein
MGFGSAKLRTLPWLAKLRSIIIAAVQLQKRV